MRLEELCSNEFMMENTSCTTIQDFVNCSPAEITTDDLLTDEVQDLAFEEFVKDNSKYNSWGSLIVAALNDYLARNYG